MEECDDTDPYLECRRCQKTIGSSEVHFTVNLHREFFNGDCVTVLDADCVAVFCKNCTPELRALMKAIAAI